ncbi:glycosyltransferase [Antarcticirhabdus aurantiaca]|uniref:Uncharacterized protein n=1 Tax=Antarcticirhabdus aurantiaca TaxID=2606717 RepID=A0ACD4NL08_9HYPH|nr:glycosyltransferase [Antarcticirhabdus aurantiaca]WAJ27479.1 hypothetical protein OXU80_21940 [Jeongeuplla avenae]
MTRDTPSRSSIGSLVAARRKRLALAAAVSAPPLDAAEPQPLPPPSRPDGLQLQAVRTGAGVEGHAFDPADPERRLVVELLLDDWPTELRRADRFEAGLLASGIGDGCHGFRFALDPASIGTPRRIGVRLANLPEGACAPVEVAADPPAGSGSGASLGLVEWSGGLVLRGWVPRPGDGAAVPLVDAVIDGQRVAGARPDGWRRAPDGRVAAGFAIALPREFADGTARRVEVRQNGRALSGSPMTVIAFADGLEAELAGRAGPLGREATRGRLVDLARPDAVPFSALEAWEARFMPLSAGVPAPGRSVAVMVVGDGKAADETLAAANLAGHAAWIGGVLSDEAGPARFAAADLLAFLEGEAADCGTILCLAAGAALRPGAAGRLCAALAAEPSAVVAYGDLLLGMEDGATVPLALPAFDAERFLEQASAQFAFAIRRTAALKAARRGAASLFSLFLAPLAEEAPRGRSHLHVPGFAARLAMAELDASAMTAPLGEAARSLLTARGLAARTEPRPDLALPALRLRREAGPTSATIVLDAARLGGGEAGLDAAIAALEPVRARRRARLVLVAAGVSAAQNRRFALDGIALAEPAPREMLAARLNRGCAAAETDLVLLLDARLRAKTPDLLDEMIGRMADPDVGAVAPVIVAADGLVVEAGFVLRPSGRVASAFCDSLLGEAGYGDGLAVARQASATGASCLLARRSDLQAVGGFDAQLFPADGAAIDLCLKLQALGRRLVVTPDARLSWPDGQEPRLDATGLLAERARRMLLARWPDAFACDPFASPLLDRGVVPHSGLAWPPGPLRPRLPALAPPRDAPLGW